MKLIGTYQIFGLLGDHSVLWRKKLRTYRCIQNIQKDLGQFFLSAGISVVPYQMADQSLWHRGVYSIHGHMIPVIGCPAKGQL